MGRFAGTVQPQAMQGGQLAAHLQRTVTIATMVAPARHHQSRIAAETPQPGVVARPHRVVGGEQIGSSALSAAALDSVDVESLLELALSVLPDPEFSDPEFSDPQAPSRAITPAAVAATRAREGRVVGMRCRMMGPLNEWGAARAAMIRLMQTL